MAIEFAQDGAINSYLIIKDKLYKIESYDGRFCTKSNGTGLIVFRNDSESTIRLSRCFARYFNSVCGRLHIGYDGESLYVPGSIGRLFNGRVTVYPGYQKYPLSQIHGAEKIEGKSAEDRLRILRQLGISSSNGRVKKYPTVRLPDQITLDNHCQTFFDFAMIDSHHYFYQLVQSEILQFTCHVGRLNDNIPLPEFWAGAATPEPKPNWIMVRRIPLEIHGQFYVYQTSRNALCLLDSQRQLHYIAPIGGGAMVKKVQKLDYPVKIVYSGKTIDIIAQNTSFHLDAAGQLSSPAKTVWPKK